MTREVARIWGMDGRLEGAETDLQGRLPFFRFDGHIYAARVADWSFEDGSLQRLTEEEAVERGASLPFAQHLLATPGRLVVATGPRFIEWCRDLALDIPNAEARSSDGFEVSTMPVEYFARLAATLMMSARKIFDKELRANGDLTDRAQFALEVLRSTCANDPRAKFIRSIAAARLACDPDSVRRLSKLAQIRLHTSAEGLRADVDEYLTVVLNDPRAAVAPAQVSQAALTLESVKADLRQIVRAEFSTYVKQQSFPTAQPHFVGMQYSGMSDPIYENRLAPASQSMQTLQKDDPLMQPFEAGNA